MHRGATLSGVLAAACALSAVGCLESTPPASSGYVGGNVTPPAKDAGPSERGDAGATNDAALSDAVAAVDGVAAAWAGTWAFTSGSEGLLCDNGLSAIAVSGVLVITAAPSGRALTVQEDGCSFAFALVGDTATSAPNQACAAWAVPTIPSWTLTMQPDGTLAEKLGGQVWIDGAPCEISGGSTLARQ